MMGLVLLLAAQTAIAETCDQLGNPAGNEGRVHSDFCREWLELHPCREQLSKPCSAFTPGHLVGIAQTLATGQPLHIAYGSLAPQNGFGMGLAFVEHKDFADEWRITFNTDAVTSSNGSWRAGAYLKGYKLGGGQIIVVNGPGKKTAPFFHLSSFFNLYAETNSLNRLYFYGLGPNTLPAGQAAFGMTETIVGTNAVVPLGKWGLSLFAEVNGRVPQLRPDRNETVPSIEKMYTEATAPGVSAQPVFVQPGLGVRAEPKVFNDHLRLHYLVDVQNYGGFDSSAYSFRRWTGDFGHEFPLNKKVSLTAASNANGPDSCTPNPSSPCPLPTRVSKSMDTEGSVNVRLLMVGSAANAGSVVPFYFDPTLGGSDLDGNALLSSFPDYRFRAPNLVLLRESVEHAIPRVPLGVYFQADEAKVGLRRGDIDFTNLRETYTVGLTVHAGGLPVVSLLFSWGGGEGNHTTFNVSNVLLGASARPSLY